MTKEEKLFVKECDCPEIQKGWEPKLGDMFFNRAIKEIYTVYDPGTSRMQQERSSDVWRDNCIFLPSLDKLIALMGERFQAVVRFEKDIWDCFITEGDTFLSGSTPKLAAVKAYKEIKKENFPHSIIGSPGEIKAYKKFMKDKKAVQNFIRSKEPKACEKCGGEIGNKVMGDEVVAYCKECNWATR